MRIFTTMLELHNAKHNRGTDGFQCDECGAVKMFPVDGFGTGYAGSTRNAGPVCYACCGVLDRQQMRTDGKTTLYLSKTATGWKVGNWCGTLEFPAYGIRKSFHNFAGRDGRTDFYFRADGREWHGVNIGNSQIARCKRLKTSDKR